MVTKEAGFSVTQRKSVTPRAGGLLHGPAAWSGFCLGSAAFCCESSHFVLTGSDSPALACRAGTRADQAGPADRASARDQHKRAAPRSKRLPLITNIAESCYLLVMARPEQFPIAKLVRLDEALAERINEFRFRERFKTEADAIRELIRRSLEGASGTKLAKAQAR